MEVVTLAPLDVDATQLHHEVLRLQARIRKLIALLRVLLVVLKISRFQLNQTRLPDGYLKRSLLRVIDQARSALPLRSALRIAQLSSSRYHHWKRENQCELDDSSSCPRMSPHQLTAAEVECIRDLATSQEYRHVPPGTLAVLAQRLGKFSASPSTWYRLIREHQWRRPRARIHPAKPKIGIRASHPNEIWHISLLIVPPTPVLNRDSHFHQRAGESRWTTSSGPITGRVVHGHPETDDFRVERIVSHGHASHEGFWYDQDQKEWVMVLEDAARIRFEDGTDAVELRPGDYLTIPAHKRHRVEWTVPDQRTVWLAIHFQG